MFPLCLFSTRTVVAVDDSDRLSGIRHASVRRLILTSGGFLRIVVKGTQPSTAVLYLSATISIDLFIKT